MPLKQNKQFPPVCINHPDKKMTILESKRNQLYLHILPIVQQMEKPNITYQSAGEATGVKVYACQICGYCEIYLSKDELEQHQSLD